MVFCVRTHNNEKLAENEWLEATDTVVAISLEWKQSMKNP